MDDMLETMYEAPGIGLAAVQVGILKRLIVIDISKDDKKKSTFAINPKIIYKSKKSQLLKKVAYLFQDTLLKLRDLLSVI